MEFLTLKARRTVVVAALAFAATLVVTGCGEGPAPGASSEPGRAESLRGQSSAASQGTLPLEHRGASGIQPVPAEVTASALPSNPTPRSLMPLPLDDQRPLDARPTSQPVVTIPPRSVPPVDSESRDDLSHERVVQWAGYEVVDGSTLRVSLMGGHHGCHGIRTIVEEDARTVRIAVLEGRPPKVSGTCPELAMALTVLIELEAPLGDRHVTHLDPHPSNVKP